VRLHFFFAIGEYELDKTAQGQPGRAVHGRQGHRPQVFRQQRKLSIALSARWLLIRVCGSSAKPSIATIAASMVTGGEPGPKVGELPSTRPPLFTPSSSRSGNAFSPPARVSDSFIKLRSSAPEVPPTASPKENKAAPALRSRWEKTKNRRKKG
jgi:hypothetical protein